jgi:FtsP/CotA-like multicopper oxidase with cupredoxin domain
VIALLFLLAAAGPGDGIVRVQLEAGVLSSSTGAFLYAYNGTNPGPTIRTRVGDTLEVELKNNLPFATTIHWHGVKVPWAMDGVTWMQSPVAPGASFTYRFVLEQAGTFWYHPHLDTDAQVDGGLYGMLIVEDPNEPETEELTLIFDSTRERGEHSAQHGAGKLEDHWLVNGAHMPIIPVRGGSVIRGRLLNASNTAYLALTFPKIRLLATDQGLLPALDQPRRILLAPGDRAEVELLPGREDIDLVSEPYTLNGGDALGEMMMLARLKIGAAKDPASGARWPFQNQTPDRDPRAPDLVYVFTGSDRNEAGLINGERFPNITVEEVALGSEPILELRNLSPSEHPFHVHGVRFEVLSVNGVPTARRTIEDTINLRIRDRVRIRVFADNPGDWMLHCHILPHAEHGMMTVLRIRP